MGKIKATIILVSVVVLVAGCVSVKPAEDIFYIPNYYADSGAGSVVAAAFNPAARSFSEITESATAAFYSGEKDTALKKVGSSDDLEVVSTQKETITKFRPNTEDIMVIKTDFNPGFDLTFFFTTGLYTAWMESSRPNNYEKDLFFDIDKIEGDYIESEYVLAAINRGNSVVKDLYIVDVLAAPVEFISARYTTDDLFIPLNVNLAAVDGIEQKLVSQGDKKALVFHVLSKKDGLKPGDMVQIIVKARIRKNDLMKPEYMVKN
jgi:hypothetical protein